MRLSVAPVVVRRHWPAGLGVLAVTLISPRPGQATSLATALQLSEAQRDTDSTEKFDLPSGFVLRVGAPRLQHRLIPVAEARADWTLPEGLDPQGWVSRQAYVQSRKKDSSVLRSLVLPFAKRDGERAFVSVDWQDRSWKDPAGRCDVEGSLVLASTDRRRPEEPHTERRLQTSQLLRRTEGVGGPNFCPTGAARRREFAARVVGLEEQNRFKLDELDRFNQLLLWIRMGGPAVLKDLLPRERAPRVDIVGSPEPLVLMSKRLRQSARTVDPPIAATAPTVVSIHEPQPPGCSRHPLRDPRSHQTGSPRYAHPSGY